MTHHPTDTLLPRLDRVRERGPGRWTARCPAHDDRTPSLSIRETEDSRVLIHCWTGCEAAAIVAAIGLELADLFPPRPRPAYETGAVRTPPIPWRDMLAAMIVDLTACAVAFRDLAEGRMDYAGEDAAYIARRSDDLAAAIRVLRRGVGHD